MGAKIIAVAENKEFLLAIGEDAKKIMSLAWRSKAMCEKRGIPVRWFYESRTRDSVRSACEDCTVRSECLEEVLIRHEQHGFFAGYSGNQRKAVYKRWLAAHIRRGTFPPGNHKIGSYQPQPIDRKIAQLLYKADHYVVKPDEGSMLQYLFEMLGDKPATIGSRLTAMERQGLIQKIWASKRRIKAIELTQDGLERIEADPSFIEA